MRMSFTSPVQDVPLPAALKITLDNYYDLLKTQAANLKANEYLQLKLAADVLDVSDDKSDTYLGYTWFSYYNMVGRSDRAIHPVPVAGEIQIGIEALADVYGVFLRKLRTYVITKALTPAEQLQVADHDKTIQSLRKDANNFALEDRANWKIYADAMGYEIGNNSAYVQWSSHLGNWDLIEQRMTEVRQEIFDRKSILDRKYPTPEDRAVVDAEFAFEDAAQRLRYPVYPDYVYADGKLFDPGYLARLPTGSTALFDDRRSVNFGLSLHTIKTARAAGLGATFTRADGKSSSITTDWKGSASASYFAIRVNADAGEQRTIQEDFSHTTSIELKSESCLRIEVKFPAWFQPTLFNHKHVMENPHDFEQFFGAKGTLLYHPSALIVVRGFNVKFTSSQDWSYDYKSHYSVSGRGGFNAFGVSFGGSASYSKDVHEHEVDRSGTELTITDDPGTVRFVGYAVVKNDVFTAAVDRELIRVGLVAGTSNSEEDTEEAQSSVVSTPNA